MPGNVMQVAVGIYGKLPARGDFVRVGLPRDFVDAWDGWLCSVMSVTRKQAGDAWLPAFLEAPVWRFALPAGRCGSGPVIGVMLPSVDRAGRYFPLTLAAVGRSGDFAVDDGAEDWLDCCEHAGLAALEKDAAPDRILTMLGVPVLSAGVACDSAWWTCGSARVAAGRYVLTDLPGAALYAEMLGAGFEGTS
jgi:type VI secretion system protein ImpM